MTLNGLITEAMFRVDEYLNHRFFRWVTRSRIDRAVASERFCRWVDRRLWREYPE